MTTMHKALLVLLLGAIYFFIRSKQKAKARNSTPNSQSDDQPKLK